MSNYNIPSSINQTGALAVFRGGTDPRKAGFGSILSEGIEILIPPPPPLKADGEEALSHSGVVPPGLTLQLDNSTIRGGVSGPQRNLLSDVLDEYAKEGGKCWLYPFSDPLAAYDSQEGRFLPDWSKYFQFADSMFALVKSGHLHYGALRLGADLIARLDWISYLSKQTKEDAPDLVAQKMVALDHGIVCSEYFGMSAQSMGLKAACLAAGIAWLPGSRPTPGAIIGCSPEDCRDLGLYDSTGKVRMVGGMPGSIYGQPIDVL